MPASLAMLVRIDKTSENIWFQFRACFLPMWWMQLHDKQTQHLGYRKWQDTIPMSPSRLLRLISWFLHCTTSFPCEVRQLPIQIWCQLKMLVCSTIAAFFSVLAEAVILLIAANAEGKTSCAEQYYWYLSELRKPHATCHRFIRFCLQRLLPNAFAEPTIVAAATECCEVTP